MVSTRWFRGCCEITVASLRLLAVLLVLSASPRLATLISQQPLKRRVEFLLVVLFLSLLAGAAGATVSSHMDMIRNRGEIVVGVKMDYPPFGMLDRDGTPIGLEHD